jgi:hypothetical protein
MMRKVIYRTVEDWLNNVRMINVCKKETTTESINYRNVNQDDNYQNDNQNDNQDRKRNKKKQKKIKVQ